MTELEEQVLDEVWSGYVPLKISLSKYDISFSGTPLDYYICVPRCSYLPLIVENIRKHFDQYTSTDYVQDEIWFSYKSVPLKWHYPIGFLLDIFSSILYNSVNLNIPFEIEVNFRRFPADILLPYKGIKSLYTIFQNSLKESCAMLLGTSAPVLNLSREQEDKVWNCVKIGNYKGFAESTRDFTGLNQENCKLIPVKIYYQKMGNGIMLHPFLASEQKKVLDAVREVVGEFQGKIVAQGIEIPGDSDLHWLWKCLAHPDNFLYITLLDL